MMSLSFHWCYSNQGYMNIVISQEIYMIMPIFFAINITGHASLISWYQSNNFTLESCWGEICIGHQSHLISLPTFHCVQLGDIFHWLPWWYCSAWGKCPRQQTAEYLTLVTMVTLFGLRPLSQYTDCRISYNGYHVDILRPGALVTVHRLQNILQWLPWRGYSTWDSCHSR